MIEIRERERERKEEKIEAIHRKKIEKKEDEKRRTS
jgi:hypothetical protein